MSAFPSCSLLPPEPCLKRHLFEILVEICKELRSALTT
jgi:hypothetical protein